MPFFITRTRSICGGRGMKSDSRQPMEEKIWCHAPQRNNSIARQVTVALPSPTPSSTSLLPMTVIALKLDLSPDYDAVQEKKIIGGAEVDSSLSTQDSKTRSLLDLHKFTSNILYNIILSLSSDFRVLGDKIRYAI